jgi:hypothetical protein
MKIRIILIITIVSLLILISSENVNAQTEDITAPELLNFSISPVLFDTTLEDVTISFCVTASDNISGTGDGSVRADSPGSMPVTGFFGISLNFDGATAPTEDCGSAVVPQGSTYEIEPLLILSSPTGSIIDASLEILAHPMCILGYWGQCEDLCALGYPCSIENSPPKHLLFVIKRGFGSGTVTSVPMGIDCGSFCDAKFIESTAITLTAKADIGAVFSYWSGGCVGTDEACTLIMTEDVTVTAHFVSDETKEYKLKVKKAKKNGGDGTVTSNDGIIDCGDICFHTYYKDTVVTLSAQANGSSTFLGWKPESLNCIGTGSCTVTIDKAKTVQAVFLANTGLKWSARARRKAQAQ